MSDVQHHSRLTIGILHPGDMGHNVARVLLEDGFSPGGTEMTLRTLLSSFSGWFKRRRWERSATHRISRSTRPHPVTSLGERERTPLSREG